MENISDERESLVARMLNVLPIDTEDQEQVELVRASVMNASKDQIEQMRDDVEAAEAKLRDEELGYVTTEHGLATEEMFRDATPQRTPDLSDVMGFDGFDQ